MDHRRRRSSIRRAILMIGAGLLISGLAACGADRQEQPAPGRRLAGTLTAPAGARLPLEARARVRLVDLSTEPPTVLREQMITPPGQFPISFAMTLDPTQIDTTHRYVVQAMIRVDQETIWLDAGGSTVLTLGHPDSLAVVMTRPE